MTHSDGRALAVGLSSAERAAVAEADGVTSVEAVGPDTFSAAIAAHQPACVVVADDPPDVEVVSLARAATADSPDLPVVAVADGDEDRAADAVAAGATRYVPRSRGPEAIATATTAALEAGARRRRAAAAADAFEAVLERAPIQIYVTDTDARHLFSTKAVHIPEMNGRTHAEQFEDGWAAAVTDLTREVIESERSVEDRLTRYEVEASDIDDIDAGWIRSWIFPWYGGDEDASPRGAVGFTQDVTDVEQTKAELTRANDLLEQFASVVTHDLRNPLNVAQGNLELARETGEAEFFEAVAGGHERMAEIIDDLVRLTRDSEGEQAHETVPLARVVADAWETVDPAEATLDLAVDDALVRADRGPLQQLFENLFRNAEEHVAGATVTVGLLGDGFYVADDGPGLPPELVEQLNGGEFNAGGLGLNIVRTIADRHGWSFRAGESDAGGARFEVGDTVLIRHGETAMGDRRPVSLETGEAVSERASGSVERTGDGWTVTGRGRNLWRSVNEFYFVHGTVTGDADLVARIADFDPALGKSKVGVMARSGLDPGSPHAYVGMSRDSGLESLWQLEPDAGTQSRLLDGDAWIPQWFRLTRHGDTVTVFSSEDGVEWTPVDEQVVPLGDEAHYGLVVTSHTEDADAVATFDNTELADVTWDS